MSDDQKPYELLRDLEARLYEAVPPLDPPYLYWLTSDASYSYCRPCARKARWLEMGNVGDPPWEPRRFESDPIEENIFSGIDGGFEQMNGDHCEVCETCGRTLWYTLTEYGVSEELDGHRENPGYGSVGPEDTYRISRICLNLTWSGADEKEVLEAIVIVESALAVVVRTAS